MHVFVKLLSGATVDVVVESSDTVFALKQKVYDCYSSSSPPDHERDVVVFAGKQLADDCTLEDCSIDNDASVDLHRHSTLPAASTHCCCGSRRHFHALYHHSGFNTPAVLIITFCVTFFNLACPPWFPSFTTPPATPRTHILQTPLLPHYPHTGPPPLFPANNVQCW